MVAKLPVANVIQINHIGHTATTSNMWSTKIHFRYTEAGGGTPSQSEIDTVANHAFNQFANLIMPRVNGDRFIDTITAMALDNNSTLIGTFTETTQGQRTGGTLPASCCFITSYTISTRWRGGRPKNYWPAMGDTDLSNPSTWDGTAVTNYADALGTYIGNLTGFNVQNLTLGNPCVISYVETVGTEHGVPRTPPLVLDVEGAVPRATIGSQRRRIRSTTP